MHGHVLQVAVSLLLGVGVTVSAAEGQETVIQRSLRTYCDQNGVKRDELRPAKLPLLPGMEAFRYPLKPTAGDKENRALPERYAVVFVDTACGGVVEFKVFASKDHHTVRRNLLAAMTLHGRKVTNNQEAGELISTLF